MAVITADGYSFVNDALEDTGFTSSLVPSIISDGNETHEVTYSLLGLSISDRQTEPGWANTFSGNILYIWQNPVFINAYCPIVGPTRPTTGQVYPRGYS